MSAPAIALGFLLSRPFVLLLDERERLEASLATVRRAIDEAQGRHDLEVDRLVEALPELAALKGFDPAGTELIVRHGSAFLERWEGGRCARVVELEAFYGDHVVRSDAERERAAGDVLLHRVDFDRLEKKLHELDAEIALRAASLAQEKRLTGKVSVKRAPDDRSRVLLEVGSEGAERHQPEASSKPKES